MGMCNIYELSFLVFKFKSVTYSWGGWRLSHSRTRIYFLPHKEHTPRSL